MQSKSKNKALRIENLTRWTNTTSKLGEQARAYAGKLVPELEGIFETAGKSHDLGKGRAVWQRAMGRCPGNCVAKSFRPPAPKQMGGFRHELASLVDVVKDSDSNELTLHLVASHHGGARPFFAQKAQDTNCPQESRRVMDETPERFGRLTEEWGPWGLAYLEAILKAADVAVSKDWDEQSDE